MAVPRRRFNLALDEELYLWMKQYAFDNKTSVTSVLTDFIVKLKESKERNSEDLEVLKRLRGKTIHISPDGDISEIQEEQLLNKIDGNPQEN